MLVVEGNQLTGTIPDSLTTLTALAYATFSFNAFTGAVPSFGFEPSVDYNCFTNCTQYPSRAASCPCAVPALAPGDKQALVDLFYSTGGPNWYAFSATSFNISSDPCQAHWSGVTCTGDSPNRVK